MKREIKTDGPETYLKEMIGLIGDALPEDGPGRYTAEELILAVTYADAVTNRGIERSDAFNSILLKPNIEKVARYIIDKAENGDLTREQIDAMGSIATIAIGGYHAIGQFIYAEEKGIPAENNMDTAMQLLGVKNPVVNDYREKEPPASEPSDVFDEVIIYFSEHIIEVKDDGTEDTTETKTQFGPEDFEELVGETEVPEEIAEPGLGEQRVTRYASGLVIPIKTQEEITEYLETWEQEQRDKRHPVETEMQKPESYNEATEVPEEIAEPDSGNQRFAVYDSGLKIPIKTQEEITEYLETWEQEQRDKKNSQ